MCKNPPKVASMQVEPEDYEKRVANHLQTYRPKQYAQAKKDGSLDSQVKSLSAGIADWVNSQQPKDEDLKNLNPQERANKLRQAQMFAESDALRELLPRDEATEKLIGPTGGYEDKTSGSLRTA